MHHHTALLHRLFGDDVTMTDGHPSIANPAVLESEKMDGLARAAVFGEGQEREMARWILWQIGQSTGVRPASIHELYLARGRGEIAGFTVPAINVRGATYDTARSIFRTAKKLDAGAFILEIARSEIVYTDQRPAEYVSVLIAAALREGFAGPLFIQGDHFQVNAKKFKAGAEAEVHGVKELAREAIAAGFYNIDIDTSTLVDLSKGSLDEQQRLNYEVGVDILKFVRSLEPNGVTISTGGEIGEVGTENSTVQELEAFMDGFNRTLPGEMVGLSKISVQSGTSHGGTVLPDGSIADVALDFNTLRDLSKVAREKYGMAGAVQHGASTLPDTLFDNFPRVETAEIHLATNFQNMLYDHMPAALREEIYGWLRENAKDERKEKDTDEQFFYKTRKKALGPFKRQLWDLPAGVKEEIAAAYDRKFEFLFTQLAVGGTMQHVRKFVHVPQQYRPMPGAGEPVTAAAHDDAEAGE
ncbi:MAG TPA: class II fructose-bisphosphate aldolase [Gemmatimonadaceae bacterium]